MYSTITSGTIYGIRSRLIQVEVDISQGLPGFQIVGLPGSEVREARERVKVALKNVGVALPAVCINVNLSPADIPKSGTMFDLPVAVGILTALSRLPAESVKDTLFVGELGLSGEVKPVKGVLPVVREAFLKGIKRCILPQDNAWEGQLVTDMESIGVADLQAAVRLLTGAEVRPARTERQETFPENGDNDGSAEDFADISGQESLKRAAEEWRYA